MSKKVFESPEKYASYRLEPLRLGPIRKSKFYEMTAAAELTKGDNPVSEEDIQTMGVKKAAALARVPAEMRTKKLVEMAKSKPLTEVTYTVQELLNRDVPVTERKEPTMLFSRTLACTTVAKLERLERLGVRMPKFANADRSVSLVSQFWDMVETVMWERYHTELTTAEKILKAEERGKENVETEKSKAAKADAVEAVGPEKKSKHAEETSD